MRINGPDLINHANRAYESNRGGVKSNRHDADAPAKDSIVLSEVSRKIGELMKNDDLTADAAEQKKVTLIRQAVEKGQYQVSPKELADAICQRIAEQKKTGE